MVHQRNKFQKTVNYHRSSSAILLNSNCYNIYSYSVSYNIIIIVIINSYSNAIKTDIVVTDEFNIMTMCESTTVNLA